VEDKVFVKTQLAVFEDGLSLESGKVISPLEITFETYGALNRDKTNAVLICHALSGNSNAAFWHQSNKKSGWWDIYIGPGRAIDTDKYFVVCSNVIGGCNGSSGPISINPKTGRPYGLEFPVVTINDMVNAQDKLRQFLGIPKWLCVIGGSMGGMQALSWAFKKVGLLNGCIAIATTMKHTAQQIAFNAVGRQAIMRDPAWRNGDYYDKDSFPYQGLAVARMIGHITYLSDEAMNIKFARRLREKEKYGYDFSIDFEIESYLRHQGDSFVRRFDANSYLYLTKAIDYFDLESEIGEEDLDILDSKFLLISFTSDWLYPPSQVEYIAKLLTRKKKDVSYCRLSSDYGHDAFLLYNERQARALSGFLKRIYEEL